ncbi:unnamed protein product [Blepharisma stoltei]|uniref:NAD-dependent epimerase/dehydratase domain-containing protein n=1 Tax=Blepharisma stoltei TaxID=1481888 RepID=A0AAU9JPC0_9CILI|nr:unnamed protein product [Blepharisma stoltei]
MRVVLTGATGSIGSSVLENLAYHGHDITLTIRNEEKGQEIVKRHYPRAHYILFDININTAHQLADIAVGYDAIIHCVQQAFSQEGTEAENLTVNALILAVKKTGETKHVSLVYTLGTGLCGNTNEIIDEDHDDTSHSWDLAAPRGILEKKVINASTENVHGAALRVSWVYGKSFVDQWIRACKTNNKIIIGGNRDNSHMCFIHHEDLANMYRILIERRAYGLFFAVEPEAVTLQNLIERVSTLGNIREIERVNNPREHF